MDSNWTGDESETKAYIDWFQSANQNDSRIRNKLVSHWETHDLNG